MFNVNFVNLSLNDILKLKEKHSFLRSAHIGNFNKQTLILANLGIHILLHEHLRGNATIYEPSYIRYRNIKTKISNSDDNILQLYDNSLNLEENRDLNCYLNSSSTLRKPSQFHYVSLKMISNNIELASEFLIAQMEFIKKLIPILAKEFPEQLYRYQDKDGNSYDYVEKLKNGDLKFKCYDVEKIISKEEVVDEILKMLYSTEKCINSNKIINPEGILINSRLYLLLFSVCEVYNGRNGTQRFDDDIVDIYHFAGTQMINYLCQNEEMSKENNKFFHEAYEKLYNAFPDKLPKTINFNLISTSDLQYIGCIQVENYKIIDEIIKIYKENLKLKKEKSKIASSNIKELVKKLEKLNKNQFKQLLQGINIPKNTHKKIVELLDDFQNNHNHLIGELINYYKSSGTLIKDNEDVVQNMNFKIKDNEKKLNQLILDNLDLFYTDISQYDLLNDNKKIYISKEAYELEFKDLEAFSALIKTIKKNKEDEELEEKQKKLLGTMEFAPIQIKILPITKKQFKYSEMISNHLLNENYRVEIDERDKKIGFKIREAQLMKVPYMLIIGDKEVEENTVGVRSRAEGDIGSMSLDDFKSRIIKDIEDFK